MSLPLRIDFDEKPMRIGIAAVVVSALGITAGAAMFRGWQGAAPVAPLVYVCTETGETLRLPPQSVPGVNPKTGRRTLFRGAYCPECNRWYAAPAPNHQAGNPKSLSCHIHKIAMTFDGPSVVQAAGPSAAP
jgi:hypothetical protein